MLMDIESLKWSQELREFFQLPTGIHLPKIQVALPKGTVHQFGKFRRVSWVKELDALSRKKAPNMVQEQ